MRMVMPREHGVWAMLLAPFLIGMVVTEASLLHVLAGPGILCGYIAMNAWLETLRRPGKALAALPTIGIFGGLSALFLAFPLWKRWEAFWPLVVTGLLLLASIQFLRQKRERHFANDIIGIFALTMLLPFSAQLGGTASRDEVILAMTANVLYFTGSVFFVKSVIREKRNVAFHRIGMLYHLLITVLPIAAGISYGFALLYVPGVVKMGVVLQGRQLTAIQTGIIEIVNAVWFLIVAIWLV